MATPNSNSATPLSSSFGTDDREAHPEFWIAAYTRPKSERKAAYEIDRLGIETYVPIQTVTRQWSDRKKKIDVVVIPNIIFARIRQEDTKKVLTHELNKFCNPLLSFINIFK